jgi:CDP-diacylglycerol--glycerol-3-phosphate 3-phosphatidyltransferase
MNLPNALTLGRIFLVPLLVVVLLTKFEGRMILGVPKELVGAAIFGLASLTDWLDGYLARRRKQVTTLGQMMDPLADKLLITAALVSLVQMDIAPAWMVAVILGREFAVTVLRSIAHARGVAIPASPLGKFKMMSQVVAILALILGRDHLQQFYIIGTVALWAAVITAVASGIDYYRRFNHVLLAQGVQRTPARVKPEVRPDNTMAEVRLKTDTTTKPAPEGSPRFKQARL